MCIIKGEQLHIKCRKTSDIKLSMNKKEAQSYWLYSNKKSAATSSSGNE